jgi:hypothetical protein
MADLTSDLDAVSLVLPHSAIEPKHQLVDRRGWVNCTTDLWHPKADVVVIEHRQNEGRLVCVKGALRFAYDYGLEPTGRVFQTL